MDELKERAEIFRELLNFQYNITIGKNNKLRNISLIFDEIDFHHLIGLQYLTDKPELKKDRVKIFEDILTDKLTFSKINNSSLFYRIEKRFFSFINFERFLDSNGLVFRFNRSKNPRQKMRADYILENTIDNNSSYICIDKSDKTDDYFCRSFFPKEEIDYTVGHTRFTLLYKEKVNKTTEEKIIQYNRLK